MSPPVVWTVAVIGNPNTGKTTLFNALTGLNQQVGNYAGVTVERKIGRFALDEFHAVDLVDLPGTYSLAARSPDEMLAVDVLLGQLPGSPPIDGILAIADASNPERNFYLLSQLYELKRPMVLALNMMDVAQTKGIRIDVPKLAAALDLPVVPLSADKRPSVSSLRDALRTVLSEKRVRTGPLPQFPAQLEAQVTGLMADLQPHAAKLGRQVGRLEAFRALVDRGGYAPQRLAAALDGSFQTALETRRAAAGSRPLPAEEVRARYAWVKQVLAGAMERPARPPQTHSDKIDRVVTHWAWGTLIFAALMLIVFQSIFSWARPLMDALGSLFTNLAALVGQALPEGALRSLLCDGVLAGVGGVVQFLPQICILFLFIALLEDCGYMARAAFLMDRLFARVGLSGKSFIPLLSSFACAVPGIMASRTIENRRDRLTTILLAPLMSCSARLPVYTIMIAAFIPDVTYAGGWVGLRGLTLFALYSLGLLIAVPVAWLLKRTVLRGETPPFLIEMPSYKLPDWRTVGLRVLERAKAFLMRAGTVILAVAIVVWALAYFPHPQALTAQYAAQRTELQARLETGTAGVSPVPEDSNQPLPEQLSALDKAEAGALLRQSYLGRMGHAVEGVFRPLGWDWRIALAALAAFPAREVVVSTLGTIFNLGNTEEGSADLGRALRTATWEDSPRPLFNVPVALSIMVFFALCSQCAATLATIRRETNSWRWPLFSFSFMTVLAYLGALATYQIGMLVG